MGGTRDRAIFGAAAALLAAGTIASYRLVLGPGPGGAAAAPPRVPPHAGRLAVTATAGDVAVVRAGLRLRAAPGDALQPGDALVTAQGARAELSGPGFEVALGERGRLSIRELAAARSRLALGAGTLSARLDDDPHRSLEIEASPGAVMRTRGGEVSASRSGAGMVVAVRRGRAEFSAAGRAVMLGAPRRAPPSAGAPARVAAAIPRSLLEKARRPARRDAGGRVIVSVRAFPSAPLALLGEAIALQPDGRFAHLALLKRGAPLPADAARLAGGASGTEARLAALALPSAGGRLGPPAPWGP